MSDEPDQQPGAPHPRETMAFIGHDEAEQELAEALGGGRMHHAWLLTGPQGVGKATLAYRFTRRLFGAKQSGPRPLDVSPDDPVARRIAASSHPDLRILRRAPADTAGTRFKRDISADDARAISEFFSLSSSEGGWRVAIVDCVDDLNRHAANALLKTLEEPPPRAMLLLVCHAPGAALATIRSRCRRLALRPLSDAQVKQAALAVTSEPLDDAVLRLAGGRPGRAIALQTSGAGQLASALEDALGDARKTGPSPLLTLAMDRAGPASATRLELVLEAGQDWLHRRARESADQEGSADRYAAAWNDLNDLRGQSEGLGLDPNHSLVRAMQILYRAAA